jgi:hypothetical protein
VRRCRLLEPFQYHAVIIDGAGSHLCAADIDADADGRRLSRPLYAANARGRGACQFSTLLFNPLSAPSMIVFSALRLNMPIIGRFTSTVRV